MSDLAAPTPVPSAADPGQQRILIVTDAWRPQVNGVVRSYEYLIRELERLGHVVRVISPQDFPRLPMPGYAEIELALLPYRRLPRMIDDFAPTIVHIAVEGPLGWAARRYCLRRGRPFSTAFHTNFPAYVALRSPRALRDVVDWLVRLWVRRFHAPACHVHVATATLEQALRGWGFTVPLVRLTRGVDGALFWPDPDRAPGPVPTLLYVGRVAPEKSIEDFLSLTEAQIGPARMVIVGDGPALADLQRRYPAAQFLGTLTGPALADAYRAADVFVFPSRTDTFGMVVVEALASGLPVAARDVPGPRDIITEPALGALEDDLAQAIRRALASPGTAQSRAAHARAQYDWAAVAATFLHADSAAQRAYATR